jgi:hypothetical protein
MSDKVSKPEIHQKFIDILGDKVVDHLGVESVPFEAELEPPLPSKVRIYAYNVTSPPGGRPSGEYKAQLIVPDQNPGERASFNHSNGHFVLVFGYTVDTDVFILWDAGLHYDFAYSKNVQVKASTVYEALAGELGTQVRHLQTGKETVVTSNADNLDEAIQLRHDLTTERLLSD